jgi:prolyl-tRNA synthetase
MGGSASVEFMSPCSAGEDDIVTCAACDYSANVERASSPVPAPPERPASALPEAFDTPQVHTIQDLARPPYGVEPHRQIKTLVYVTDDKDETILVLLRGDHSLVEQKLVDAAGGGSLRPGHTDEILAALGARPGSLGAVGVTNVSVIADHALRGERDMVTGANRDDVHLRHVDVDRDIAIDLWADLRAVADGEPCPRCGQPLHREPALEIGHIFKLGKKYAEALGVSVQDASAAERTITMGCYGIGLERAMAAIIESHHDERGIIWPLSVAPFDIAVVPFGDTDATTPVADRLYDELTRAGLDPLLDDRPGRVGAKLKDVELIGIPYRLVVGPRSVAEGVVELTDRASGQTVKLPIDDASGQVAGVIADAKVNLGPGEAIGTTNRTG